MRESSTTYEMETHVPSSSSSSPDFTNLPVALTREDDASAWTSAPWYGAEVLCRGAHDSDRLWIRFGVSYPSVKPAAAPGNDDDTHSLEE